LKRRIPAPEAPGRPRNDASVQQLDPSFYERLVQSVVDYAIFMLDPEGRVSSWNPGAEVIKGYTAEEIIGRHFSRFYTEEDRAARLPQKALDTAMRDGRFTTEGWRVRKDGSRFWAMVVIDAVRSDQGELLGFAKVTRDLTEQHTAQLELEHSQLALFQAQKMEAVGQLTGGLAHDFNNLLTSIIGSLELVGRRLSQGRIHDAETYIEAGLGAASRAASITHRMLAFSRRQTLEPKALDANRLVGGMRELVTRTIGPSICLDVALAGGLWSCFCDPNQLENALLNLCINARDAMPEGGRLSIETRNVWLDEREGRERELRAGPYVVINVNDNGVGMSPEVATRAFEPFFTTKPPGHGTGLGLSMIYGFARQSGGQAHIRSEPGKGTTVAIYLPRHQGAPAPQDLASERPEAPKPASGESVLVVDDEPTIRMLIGDALSELGYRAIEVGDVRSGLSVLESDAQIDLLITDIGLPGGVTGKQMADLARRRRPDLKVLFITGYAENVAISNESLEPGMHILSKPFAMDRLTARIRSIIDSDRPNRPAKGGSPARTPP